MMCSRMLIMFDGKILAADTPENLQRLMAGGSQIVAEIAAGEAELNEVFSQLPGVDQFDVSASDGEFHRCALTPRDGYDLRPAIFALARERGWMLRELTRSRHLAGGYLRPGDEAERRGGKTDANFFHA